MPIQPTCPGVYVDEMPSGVRVITGVPTSIAAFIGWAAKGPTDHAQRILSWADFKSQFGGLDIRSLLGYAVSQFFLNGGLECYVVRLASDGSAASVLEPNDGGQFETAITPGNGGGIDLLDQVDLFNLLCIPGESNTVLLTKVQKYCHERRAMLLVDCAANATFSSIQSGASGLTGINGINAAFYFPWLNAADPLQNDQVRSFPPCGFVAGIFARTDATRGVWKAPAGTDASVKGATSVTVSITDEEDGVLNPRAINCIRNLPVHGIVVWGARTLSGNNEIGTEWKYIPVRRTALFLEESIYRGTKWVVFEPNDEVIWAQIRLTTNVFLHALFRQGAFQGQTPKEAYFVKCDMETTTQDDINKGVLNIVVGFAPLKPAEFVVVTIQQRAGQLAS